MNDLLYYPSVSTFFLKIQFPIYAATNTSMKLHGTAQNKRPLGRIPMFHIPSQSNAKPRSQVIIVLCKTLNLVVSQTNIVAKMNAHNPHIDPLIGSLGNTKPSILKPSTQMFLINSSLRINSEMFIQTPAATTANINLFISDT